MAESLDWLPPLVTLDGYSGNWWDFKQACYEIYCQDFVDCVDALYFNSKIVTTDNDMTEYGWEETFRHIVLGNKRQKKQDMSRFEKIRWIRPIIQAADNDRIPWWYNVRSTEGKRGGQKRLVISLPDFSYKVIMRITEVKYVLFDAYTCYGHEIKKMKKEYDEWLKLP